jgi:2,4-didehydro-3-deoxy-L-rhamnonate hydrolase
VKLANLRERLVLVFDDGCIDVHTASGGALPSDPTAAYAHFEDLEVWARQADLASVEIHPFEVAELGAPVPRPRQIFGIGLKYDAHAAESGFQRPAP